MVEIIEGTANGERLDGTIAAEIIIALAGNDVVFGDGPAPGVSGSGSGVDQYLGGDDTILGGDGNDWLSGGHGADHLWGGADSDRFAFGTHIPIDPLNITPEIHVLDTGIGEGARDVVHDFQQGVDVIDLSLLLTLGYRSLNIDDAYEFIGTAAFTGERAQARYAVEDGKTIVQLDGLGGASFPRGVDREVDAEIELQGEYTLGLPDFIL